MKENTLPLAYGAFELKRTYQKSFSISLGIAALFHILLIGGILFYGYLSKQKEEKVLTIKNIADLGPPPTITQIEKPQIPISQPIVTPPAVGTPKPIPDEQAAEDITFATQKELQDINTEAVTGDSVNIVIPDSEYLPPMDTFISVQEQPKPIKIVDPEYPELAKQAGIEGTVIVAALIDKNGKVRDAKVVKSSGTNVGFEELALKAIMEWEFKPAIQNNNHYDTPNEDDTSDRVQNGKRVAVNHCRVESNKGSRKS